MTSPTFEPPRLMRQEEVDLSTPLSFPQPVVEINKKPVKLAALLAFLACTICVFALTQMHWFTVGAFEVGPFSSGDCAYLPFSCETWFCRSHEGLSFSGQTCQLFQALQGTALAVAIAYAVATLLLTSAVAIWHRRVQLVRRAIQFHYAAFVCTVAAVPVSYFLIDDLDAAADWAVYLWFFAVIVSGPSAIIIRRLLVPPDEY